MNPPKTKMVCIIRKDLRNTDGNKVPKGKLIAQGGHAYTGLLLKAIRNKEREPILQEWLDDSFVKIALEAETEDELLKLYGEAILAGLNAVLITDNGHTEFGKPTTTCIGIGPDYSDVIDSISGHLKGYR